MRRFVNELPQASTVHWHVVRLENAMDGAPEVTQAVVCPVSRAIRWPQLLLDAVFWPPPSSHTGS